MKRKRSSSKNIPLSHSNMPAEETKNALRDPNVFVAPGFGSSIKSKGKK